MAATREQDTGAAPGREASGPASGQAGDTSEREQLRLKEETAELGRLGEDLLGWFRDSLALLGTEARLFLATLLLVVALAAMVGLLVAGAWVFLGAAAVLMLVREGGVNPALATFAGAAVLTVTAVLVYAWIRRLARELGFARTRAGWAALFRAEGRHAARKTEE
jgi:hypothetical protein